MEINIRLAASLAELLAPGAEPAILQLLKGCQFNVKINVWKKLADVMMKIVEVGGISSSILPFVGCIGPAALLKVNGTLDIEVDEHMKKSIASNPMVEPLLTDINSMISTMTHCSHNDDMDSYIDNNLVFTPPQIKKVIKFFIAHMGDEIDFMVCHPHFGIKGLIAGKGLSDVLKTSIKFMVHTSC
jgi:hypothetical protein